MPGNTRSNTNRKEEYHNCGTDGMTNSVLSEADNQRLSTIGEAVTALTRRVNQSGEAEDDLAAVTDRRLTNLEKGLDALTQQVSLLTSTVSTLTAELRARPRVNSWDSRQRTRSASPGGGACFNCGLVGHFSRDCPKKEHKVQFSDNQLNRTGSVPQASLPINTTLA